MPNFTRTSTAFFGSVFATLNHILVADTIWLKRFAGHPTGFEALQPLVEITAPVSLSQTLFAELAQLETARRTMDEVIIRLCSEAVDEDYAMSLRYVTTSGQAFVNEFSILVQHFFNHQTHHRGQVTTLLSQSGVDVGPTDLVMMIREQENSDDFAPASGERQ